jgi:hypothetical protein
MTLTSIRLWFGSQMLAAVASIFAVCTFVSSAFPTLSTEEYETVCVPSPRP